jgi:environmental stress-induced protein Ves
MHFVRLAECPPQPWRNGGGTTRELLRWPAAPAGGPAAAADDWLVRVSVAEIACDGPFSPYPGVDRWFAVLEGAGVALALPEGDRLRRPGDDALAFAGEAAPGCALLDGATSDLNRMVRRRAGPATGSKAAPASMRLARPGSAQRGRHPWRALYAHAACRLRADDDWHDLPAGTLAWSDTNRPETWELAEAGLAFWMGLEAGSP